MRTVFLGPPGAGKGTQAKIFCERMGLPHLSTGDLLRAAVAEGTEPGRKAKDAMDRGELVSDALVLELLERRLERDDCRSEGFVLDGYPRNLQQARDLDDLLGRLGSPLDAVVYIDVPKALIIERLAGRRVCPNCGAAYHVANLPPRQEGVCDACGATLVQRSDDKPATIENRLRVYEASTRSLIEYYDRKGLLRPVEGGGDVNDIAEKVFQTLREES